MDLYDLAVYREARQISKCAWLLYDKFDWQTKKVIGDQWISAIDSIGANIAEGFGRFHFLDRNKFNYNARGSLIEALHWTDLLLERGKVQIIDAELLRAQLRAVQVLLNRYIFSTKDLASKK